jgi:hypothetical protein
LANFDNTRPATPGIIDSGTAPTVAEPAAAATARSDRPESAALVRFRSCRWMQAGEQSGTDFCAHREVKPYAGTAGFDAEAWCPECQYYKLRRSPKKRPVDDYTY